MLDPSELVEVSLHLASCPSCRDRWLPRADAYRHAIERATVVARGRGAHLDRERRAAVGPVERLFNLPSGELDRTVRTTPRLRTYAFVRGLLDRCRATWAYEPRRAEDLARLATRVVRHLPARDYGRRNLADLHAEAWSCIGNSRRVGNLYGTRTLRAFQAAEDLLAEGSGDPSEAAGYRVLRSSFHRCRGDLAAADEDISWALEAYRWIADPHLVGRTLVPRGILRSREGRNEEAVADYERGMHLLDPVREPRLPALVATNLAYELTVVGRAGEALSRLRHLLATLRRLATPVEKARVVWIGGSICWKLGQLEQAEALIERARTALHALRRPHDAALADLDLSHLYLETDRLPEARALAAASLSALALTGTSTTATEAADLFRRADGLG